MVNASTLTTELILQKMSKQLKCLSPDDFENQKLRMKRYSYIVNEIEDAYRIANFAERVLSLDSEAHKIELARRRAYDEILSGFAWLLFFPVALYAIGAASLIG